MEPRPRPDPCRTLPLAPPLQAPSAATVVGCGLTVAGVVLVGGVHCPLPGGLSGGAFGAAAAAVTAPSTMGLALAVVAAAANAASFCTVSLVSRGASAVVVTWWYHAVVLVASLVPPALGLSCWSVPSCHDAWLLAGVAAANFAGQLLLNRGFGLESASRGSALNTAQVFYAYMWDMAVLRHPPDACAAMGSGVIVAGIFVVSWQRPKAGGNGHTAAAAACKLDPASEQRRRRFSGDGSMSAGSARDTDRVDLEVLAQPLLLSPKNSWESEDGDGRS